MLFFSIYLFFILFYLFTPFISVCVGLCVRASVCLVPSHLVQESQKATSAASTSSYSPGLKRSTQDCTTHSLPSP